jgi:hypothetical protein
MRFISCLRTNPILQLEVIRERLDLTLKAFDQGLISTEGL